MTRSRTARRTSWVILVSVLMPVVHAGQEERQPPPDSPPVFTSLELRFPTQRNVTQRSGQDYLRLMDAHVHLSKPSRNLWVPYDAEIEALVLADAARLWRSRWLERLWVDVVDEPLENGAVGKHVIFNLVERQTPVSSVQLPSVSPAPPVEYQTLALGQQRVYPPPE